MKVKVEIKSWLTGHILFTAEVDKASTPSLELGEAVKQAVKASADLRSANLRSANLRSANLRSADLEGANLEGADLRSADLRSADLRSANLRSADLEGANLEGANLYAANLRSANLRSADLDAIQAARLSVVPEVGDYIGWKKCQDNVIVKLLIPEASKRSNATGRKCRAEFARVLEVFGAEKGISIHDEVTEYVVGQEVRCHEWGADRWVECSGGIHHYITRIEAEHH